MVNYYIREKDQPHIHAIDLEKFLVLAPEMRNLGNWGIGSFVS